MLSTTQEGETNNQEPNEHNALLHNDPGVHLVDTNTKKCEVAYTNLNGHKC